MTSRTFIAQARTGAGTARRVTQGYRPRALVLTLRPILKSPRGYPVASRRPAMGRGSDFERRLARENRQRTALAAGSLPGMELRVMRNFASGTSHLVNLADEHLSWFKWIGPEFQGTATPYITICGAVIRPGSHAAVWMQNGPVCKLCDRFMPAGSVIAYSPSRERA